MTASRASCSKPGRRTCRQLIHGAVLFLVFVQLSGGVLFGDVLRDYEELDAVQYLPVETVTAISIKPAYLSHFMFDYMGYNKILNALKEANLGNEDVVKCTLFFAQTTNSQLKESPFLELPFKATGLLARGDFSDIDYSGLISFERYLEYEIYYSSSSNCYFVKLDQDLLVMSQAPEIIGDVIDVYLGRIPGFAHGKASVLNRLKEQSMPFAPVSVIVVQSEESRNTETFLRTIISFTKLTMGANASVNFNLLLFEGSVGGSGSITFDGSQVNNIGYFEGAVLNMQTLANSMHLNLNLLFSDAKTARLAVGMLPISMAMFEALAEQTSMPTSFVDPQSDVRTGSRTEGSCAIVDLVAVLSEENAYNALARQDLRDAFTAAQKYIEEHPQAGFVQMADLTSSGFESTPGVVLAILEPQVNELRLSSRHENGDKTFFIDSSGTMSEVGGSGGGGGNSW